MTFPMPVHYARTDSPGWAIKDWDTANALLGYLEPKQRYFAIFSLPCGSYIQCLGAKTRLTVEARKCHPGGLFTHWVFGRGEPRGTITAIEVPSGPVAVDETQVLTMRDARSILRPYLESNVFVEKYHRQDVSTRFQGT